MENKGQSCKSNKYRGKKILNKYQGPKPKSDTKFKGQCSDLEGYILDLEPRALDKFENTMKYLGRYCGANSRNSCQSAIMTDTTENFTNQEMPTIIPNTGVEHPTTDLDMTYIEKKSIDESICQKLRNKCV